MSRVTRRDISMIRSLVGPVSTEQLRYIDCFVSKQCGLSAVSVGVLFLIALFFDLIASNVYQPILNAPDYLSVVYPNKIRMITGILLDFICAPAMMLIPVMLFPLLRMFNERLALGYVAFRLAEGILFISLAVDAQSILSLSRDFMNRGTRELPYFSVIGNSIHAGIEWTTSLYILMFSLGALLFYLVLLQSKLIPRWLSGWGLFAVFLLSSGDVLHMFGVFGAMPLMKVMPFFAPPIALQEIVMSIWLIVKGFDQTAIISLCRAAPSNAVQ